MKNQHKAEIWLGKLTDENTRFHQLLCGRNIPDVSSYKDTRNSVPPSQTFRKNNF